MDSLLNQRTELLSSLPEWTQSEGRVAIVHDWMTGMRGGEAILDSICSLFPKADLYTLLWTDKQMSPSILNGRKVETSYLQGLMKLPSMAKGYRKLLPIFPHAISSFDLSGYDLILSNTHCVAKGVRTRKDAVHVSYVSTPMRYVWDMFDDYFGAGKTNLPTQILAKLVRKPLQHWDEGSNDRIDALMANSRFVQKRIHDFWHRESVVVHPFVYLDRFPLKEEKVGNYYLLVSALAPYKRVDLAIEAFRRLGLPLIIVGRGQDEAKLRAMAAPNIQFLGGLSNESIAELYRKCKAFLFPGLEDFGITPLEAMACGRPVIAYGRGGLLDTVTEKTGVFFPEQNVESLMEAVKKMESGEVNFSPADCRARAEEFTQQVFEKKYIKTLADAIAAKK